MCCFIYIILFFFFFHTNVAYREIYFVYLKGGMLCKLFLYYVLEAVFSELNKKKTLYSV